MFKEEPMLIFTLKKEWYNKIATGKKSIEYREVKPYWTKRFDKLLDRATLTLWGSYFEDDSRPSCYLQLGYNPETRMIAKIKKIDVVDGKNTDLAIDKPVYAIYLENVEKLLPLEYL